MSKGVFFMFALMLIQNVYSQKVAFFDLTPKHTQRKLKEYNQSPNVYGVAEKQLKFVTKSSKKRVENKEYTNIVKQISEAQKDSVQRENAYQLKLNKFSQVSNIKVLINDFLVSNKPYEYKKEKLISAQKLAKANQINELIYADNTINKALKNKFFVMQLNQLDLKVHLKKVAWNLNQMDMVKPVRKPSTLLDQKLKDLRGRKSSLKEYKYTGSKAKTTLKNGLTTTTRVADVGLMKGEFKQIGVYYIVSNDYKNTFKKGQLLDGETVKEYNLTNKGYVGVKQILIEDIATKVKYVTESDFLYLYAFSINGKFNNGNLGGSFTLTK